MVRPRRSLRQPSQSNTVVGARPRPAAHPRRTTAEREAIQPYAGADGPRASHEQQNGARFTRIPTAIDNSLRAYAARADLDVVRDYCDIGVSGRREGRPQLNALMTAARNREIDCVLVWKFDRFARSTRHLLAALEEFNLNPAVGLSAAAIRSREDNPR